LPEKFMFTIEPKVIVRDFDYDLCTFFKSKKIPLKMEGSNE